MAKCYKSKKENKMESCKERVRADVLMPVINNHQDRARSMNEKLGARGRPF